VTFGGLSLRPLGKHKSGKHRQGLVEKVVDTGAVDTGLHEVGFQRPARGSERRLDLKFSQVLEGRRSGDSISGFFRFSRGSSSRAAAGAMSTFFNRTAAPLTLESIQKPMPPIPPFVKPRVTESRIFDTPLC
jgi:hypothetical protein